MTTIKCLTLTQPWATLVAIGAKRIETRSWSTSYRGWLAIHAAKGFPKDAQELVLEKPFEPLLDGVPLPTGAIVAITQLTHVGKTGWKPGGVALVAGVGEVTEPELSFGDYALGRYGWVLGSVLQLKTPVPCKGALGLWTPPEDVLAMLSDYLTNEKAAMTQQAGAIKGFTDEEVLAHFKAGIQDDCLVCGKRLDGYWTDFNGQMKCLTCGMTYQVLGCHLSDEYLSKHGLAKADIAKRYCDEYAFLPIAKAYWEETHRTIPLGMYTGRPPWANEDVQAMNEWMEANKGRVDERLR